MRESRSCEWARRGAACPTSCARLVLWCGAVGSTALHQGGGCVGSLGGVVGQQHCTRAEAAFAGILHHSLGLTGTSPEAAASVPG